MGISVLLLIMFVVMIALGGVTRLTGSGLSMVDWHLWQEIFPPTTPQEWEGLFSAYQATPEFRWINGHMDLNGFKKIFWLEYLHRLWGRAMGLVLAMGVFLTLLRPKFRMYFPHFFSLFVLGGLQAAMGWYMVKSGLQNDPWVSPLRLSAHFFLAMLNWLVLLWVMAKLWGYDLSIRCIDGLLALFFLMTFFYGTLVAGHKAGLIYNTFPTMDGQWIPLDFWHLKPLARNFIDNPATVQWMHRLLAATTFFTVVVVAIFQPTYRMLALIVLCQVLFGILTLLWQVPVFMGALHQLWAFAIMAAWGMGCLKKKDLIQSN